MAKEKTEKKEKETTPLKININAYITLVKDKSFWVFKNDKEALETLPSLIKETGIKYNNKQEYYELEEPKDKLEHTNISNIFKKYNVVVTKIEPNTKCTKKSIPDQILLAARKLINKFKDLDSKLTKIKKEHDIAKSALLDFTREHGINTKPGTDDALLLVDAMKLHYLYTLGQRNTNEDFLLNWLKANKPEKVITIDAIDWKNISAEEYKDLPIAVRSTFENRSPDFYKFNITDLNKNKCKNCTTKLTKNAQFCPKCGTQVTK